VAWVLAGRWNLLKLVLLPALVTEVLGADLDGDSEHPDTPCFSSGEWGNGTLIRRDTEMLSLVNVWLILRTCNSLPIFKKSECVVFFFFPLHHVTE